MVWQSRKSGAKKPHDDAGEDDVRRAEDTRQIAPDGVAEVEDDEAQRTKTPAHRTTRLEAAPDTASSPLLLLLLLLLRVVRDELPGE